MGYFTRGPTSMQRGMQGHVALPRGRARLPAWRGCDAWTRIYIYYIYYFIMYIGLSIIERQIINLTKPAYLIYWTFSFISSVWDYFISFILISGRRGNTPHVGSRPRLTDCVDAVDTRSTRSRKTHVLNSSLSEIIRAVDLTSYNGQDRSRLMDSAMHRDRPMKIQRAIEMAQLFLHAMRSHLDHLSVIGRS